MGRRKNMIWVQVKKPIALKRDEKTKMEKFVADFIEKTTKLKEKLSRIVIRAGRVYVYKLYEPAPIEVEVEGVMFTQPLIDGKYLGSDNHRRMRSLLRRHDGYNAHTYESLSPHLSEEEKAWLKGMTPRYS
jgi:hypothetical protein